MPSSSEEGRLWRRAAVLGSLWAAIEIVVGSFLHNLRIPFAGSLLASAGVMVVTAGHRTWPMRGVIWRTALVCALMKSVSPSAVILGPMVGILAEGLLLEAAVRAIGPRAPAYLIGGAMAVCWALVQKILSALLAFGPNLVSLYAESYRFAARTLGVSAVGPFDLVAVLFVCECALGVVAAASGLALGRRRAAVTDRITIELRPPVAEPALTAVPVRWSLPLLGGHVVVLVSSMVVLGAIPLWLSAPWVGAFAGLIVWRYPFALRRLRRLGFWLEAAAVMVLAGLVLGGVQHGREGLVSGLGEGLEMVLRAVLVLFGFTGIAVELRNPRLVAWLERRRLRGLSEALGLAFGTLPAFTAAISNQRAFWRRPLTCVAQMLRLANNLTVAHGLGHGRLVVVTGRAGAGKTTLAAAVVDRLRATGVPVAGVLARGLVAAGQRSGFDLTDLRTGAIVPLCRIGVPGGPGHERCGPFEFTRTGLQFGREALRAGPRDAADVYVIDEVGPLELADGGWAGALDRLAAQDHGVLLVVARLAVVDAVKARWGTPDAPVFDVAHHTPAEVADRVLAEVARWRERLEGLAEEAAREP